MNRWLISCSLVFFAPAMVLPQTAKIQAEIDKELSQARAYEDIEIMRRLVQRKLAVFAHSCRKCHQAADADAFWLAERDFDLAMRVGRFSAAGAGQPMGAGDSGAMGGKNVWEFFPHHGQLAQASESIPVDGVYVKGTGVILQAQLPASILQIMPATPGPKKQPPALSEWEVIRKQLRGEKAPTPVAQEDPHARVSQGVNLQDVLVQLLAEHGKHFQSLADNERLTLTVTFRPTTDVRAAMAGGSDMGGMGDAGGGMIGGGGIGPMGGAAPGMPQIGPRSSSKDYELLADFHLRQARYAEAAKTLEKALELNTNAVRTGTLYRKLASALLLQESGAANAQAVERAIEYLRKAQAGKPAPAPAWKTVLPTRLVISAPRSALHKAATGGLDEFRRQIAIDWLRFDHPVLRRPADDPEGGEDSDGVSR
ncbi:MAG: tetratricopeptide repeat protein [Gemmataceae bacterium]|nr:tetratricopeptide repeat protein [Gemmataceae bacterium]